MKWPMWLPLVPRKMYESELSLAWVNLAVADTRILELTQELAAKNSQIEALTIIVSQPKSVERETSAPEPSKQPTQRSFSRGGWRSRSQRLTEQTQPVASDSVAALEARVEAQGGHK